VIEKSRAGVDAIEIAMRNYVSSRRSLWIRRSSRHMEISFYQFGDDVRRIWIGWGMARENPCTATSYNVSGKFLYRSLIN